MCNLQTSAGAQQLVLQQAPQMTLVSVGLRLNSLLTVPFSHRLSRLESRVTCRRPVLQGLTATAVSLHNGTLTSLFHQTALWRLLIILNMIPLFKPHMSSHQPHPVVGVLTPLPDILLSLGFHNTPTPTFPKNYKSKELQTYQAPNCITTVLLIHPSPFPQPHSLANPPLSQHENNNISRSLILEICHLFDLFFLIDKF